MRWRHRIRILFFAVGVLAAVAVSAGQQSPLTREERWRADLDVLAKEFPSRQLDFQKLYPGDGFASGIDAIRRALPTADDPAIVLALMRLVASANVAHTVVRWPQGPLALRRLPLTLAWYGSELAVMGAAEPYRAALGMRVAKIGTHTPAELERAIAPFIAHETDVWLRQQSPGFMVTIEVLRQAGQVATDGRTVFTLARPDGTTFDLRVAPADSAIPLILAADALHVPTALFRKQPNSYYWYEYLPDTKALYIQYNRCRNDPQQSFADFTRAMFVAMDAKPIDRVVIDLRFNSGGDSTVIVPLLQALRDRPALRARGRLYTLIGGATFSSGLLAAVSLKNDLRAYLIGEPSGENLNSYGEVRELVLPHSQLIVQYSTKLFRLAKDDHALALAPDVVVSRTLADALAGRDPVLGAALAHAVR